MNTQAILTTHPQAATLSHPQALAACIDACFACAQVCSSCADACLSEEEHLTHLVACIRLDLDCADICAATGRILSRLTAPPTAVIRAGLEACQTACRACAEECEAHARDMNMAHCRVCAERCRRCEAACQAGAAERDSRVYLRLNAVPSKFPLLVRSSAAP